MGIARRHVRGEGLRLYVEAEPTYGTYIPLVGADAVRVIEASFEFVEPREDRDDAHPTLGTRARDIVGPYDIKWTTKHYLYPATAAASMSAHGLHDLLKAVWGAAASGAGADTYSPASAQSALMSLSMLRAYADGAIGAAAGAADVHFTELLKGAVVNSMKLTAKGGARVLLEFSGYAKTSHRAGRALIDGAAGPLATITLRNTLDEISAHQGFDEGALIMIDADSLDNNTDAGYPISSINRTTPSITAGSAFAAWDDGDEVMGWAPVESLPATNPIAGINGSTTIDTVTLHLTGCELSVERNLDPERGAFGQTSTPDVYLGKRVIKCTLEAKAYRDAIRWVNAAKRGSSLRDLVVNFGDVAGRYAQLNLDYGEVDFASPEFGQFGVGGFKIPLIALESAGDDEGNFKMF